MEYEAHRLRFGDWLPAAIKSISCDIVSKRLAIGREDGDIEIYEYNTSISTVPVLRFPGKKEFNLQAVKWADGRLFGISLRGFLFECDFNTISIKFIRDTYGGAAWSMAISPRDNLLAIGCDDGACRLYNYDNNGLEYVRTLPTTGSHILSLAYHPVKSQLFMGCADGSIRCVEDNAGRSIFRMTGNLARGVVIHMLCLNVLSDSTVVSGDSNGNVQIWDGNVGVLILTIHQHTAQILALTVAPTEDLIFASGVDSRVTCLRRTCRIKSTATSSESNNNNEIVLGDSNWVYTTSHRAHTHDVYALSMCYDATMIENPESSPNSHFCPLATKYGPLLISGGVDTKLCVYYVSDFVKFKPSTILPTPAKGLVTARQDGSLIALRHRNKIDLWRVQYVPRDEIDQYLEKRSRSSYSRVTAGATDIDGIGGEIEGDVRDQQEDIAENHCTLVAEIQLKDENHIICAAVNHDGSLIAASTVTGTRLWMVREEGRKNDDSTHPTYSITKVDLPLEMQSSCHILAFSSDGKLLVGATNKGNIVLLDIIIQDQSGPQSTKKKSKKQSAQQPTQPILIDVQLRDIIEHRRIAFSEGEKDAASVVITGTAFNTDGQWLAISTVGKRVFVYDLDRLVLHWMLPKFEYMITDISFHHTSSHVMAVLTCDNSFLLYNIDTQQVSDWSKENTSLLPSVLKHVHDTLVQIVFDPSYSHVLFLRSHSHTIFVDLARPVPEIPTTIEYSINANAKKWHTNKKKRETEDSNFCIINKYKGVIDLLCLGASKLVIVENPWSRILDQLPDTLARKRYGT